MQSYIHRTVVAKIIRTLVFSPAKNGFKLFLYFAGSVSVVNISLHFQTIIQWDFCFLKESDISQCSTQRSDLIIIQSVWNDMKRQTKSRRTVATSPRKNLDLYLSIHPSNLDVPNKVASECIYIRDGTIHLPPDSILSRYLGAYTISIANCF